MNQLTKYLIQELLENKQVIGLFGGGFKPPTKGHFEVVEQALKEYPELDKFIIYVGKPTRSGFPVTQEQSLIIWEIYKTLLGNKVEILPSPSPIGDIVRYGRDNPDQTVYFFLGEREGKKSDIIDIANRSKSVKGYPNIQVKVIKSPNTGISGTAARGILPNLEVTLEDFKQFLPDELSGDDKQLVYNLLKNELSKKEKQQINNLLKKGAVNEIGEANTEPYEWEETNKGKYKIEVRFKTDSKIEYIVSLYIDDYEGLKAIEVEFTAKSENDKYPSVTTVTNKGEMYRVMATITSIIKKYIEEYKIQAIIYSPSKKSDKEDDFNNQRDRLYREFISKAFPGAKYETSKQGRIAILPNVNEGTCGYDTNAETGEKLDTPGGISEADPKKGTGKKPKGSGRRLYTDEDPSDTVKVKFSTKQDIIDTLSKESFKSKSHARQSQIINLIHQRVRAAYERAKDPEVKSRLKNALEYAEQRKEASKAKTQRLNKLNEIDISKYVGSWIDTKKLKRQSNFPEAIFLYLKKEGYTNKGEIYRIITLDPLVVMIKQNTEYIDLYRFLEDNQNIEPYSDLYSTYQDEKEVVARLDSNFSFEDIHYASSTGMNMNPFLKNLDKNKLKNNILKKDQGKLLSFTKDREAANDIFYTAINHLEDDEDLDEIKIKETSNPQSGKSSPYGSGYAPVKESYQFKVSDKNYDEEDNSLISVDYKFSTPDNDYRVEFYSGEYSPKSKTFDVSFGVDKYGSKIDTFQMTGEGNALSILKTIVNIIKDFTNRFEVNKLVINPTSEKHGKIYSMMLKSLPSDILSKVELIKENQEQDWNLQDAFVSLSKFMIDKGMSIQPLPKVQFIDDDESNAQNILGKTAYYNPQSKTIVLYTLNRHPKDILRSFCHEMVHHEQNMKGTLGDIRTQNTTEDPHLDRIEREAYEKGNIMFRNWEDNYKKTWQLQILLVPSDYRVNRMNEDKREEENEGNPGGGKYTIYCDMDGVLCDFDKRFMEFSNGMSPSKYESEFGKKAFWDLIKEKGEKFWSEMEWKVDEKDPEADEKDSKKTGGKTLWEYIEKYKPIILSAPSFEKSSKDGKEKWINSNLKNVGGIKLVPANEKQKFANPNSILIDDRTSNIQQWIDKGGIGIKHTSADETIKQLKKYGL